MPFREEEDDYEASSELAALVIDGGALEIYRVVPQFGIAWKVGANKSNVTMVFVGDISN